MIRPVLFAFLMAVSTANAATPAIGAQEPRELSDSDMAEIVDFVVGNAVFALYHQAGHMMMERFGIEAARGETGADEFAAVTLLSPRSGASDQTLVDAVDSWLLSSHQTASASSGEVSLPDRHALDGDRASAIVCNMVGADARGFADVADAAGLSPERRASCGTNYAATLALWDAGLKPLRRAESAAPTVFTVAYDPPAETESVEATILQDNHVLEEVAVRLGKDFALPSPPTLRAKSCGDVTSMYDAARNELVLCYELSAFHGDLIIRDIQARN